MVITGTGRAGTTFLVQLLTNLGLETGFTPENMPLFENARAGLEWDIKKDDAPYIVKNPSFGNYAEATLQREDIVIEHVFIPMRDLYGAAESRRFVVGTAISTSALLKRLKGKIKAPNVPGGLLDTKSKSQQEEVLLRHLYKLILALSGALVPVTLLQYPRLVKDSAYLYKKLSPILGAIAYEQFLTAFKQTVRPDWVHSFSPGESDTQASSS